MLPPRRGLFEPLKGRGLLNIATVATAFFFTVLPFFVCFCRVYVMFVSNTLQM